MNRERNAVDRGPLRTGWPPAWLTAPPPKASKAINPTLVKLQSAIAKAKAKAPAGNNGQSLVRVLNDLGAIAEQHEAAGVLDSHAAGLERCIVEYVRNATHLAAMTREGKTDAQSASPERNRGAT